MTIKKFQGKTQEEATEKARQELGAGAVVMNVKEIKTFILRITCILLILL